LRRYPRSRIRLSLHCGSLHISDDDKAHRIYQEVDKKIDTSPHQVLSYEILRCFPILTAFFDNDTNLAASYNISTYPFRHLSTLLRSSFSYSYHLYVYSLAFVLLIPSILSTRQFLVHARDRDIAITYVRNSQPLPGRSHTITRHLPYSTSDHAYLGICSRRRGPAFFPHCPVILQAFFYHPSIFISYISRTNTVQSLILTTTSLPSLLPTY
jgi:hypothetical protein